MTYIYDADNLVLQITPEEQAQLEHLKAEDPDDLFKDTTMFEWLESMVCNGELEWIRPEEIEDLTDAPILGILGQEIPDSSRRHFAKLQSVYGWRPIGYWNGQHQYQPILYRWGWMNYQIESLLEHLRLHGTATLVANH